MLGQPLREMVSVADRVAQGDLATRSLVQAEFDWSAVAAQLEGVYASVLVSETMPRAPQAANGGQ